jgi:hypothetical protein
VTMGTLAPSSLKLSLQPKRKCLLAAPNNIRAASRAPEGFGLLKKSGTFGQRTTSRIKHGSKC